MGHDGLGSTHPAALPDVNVAGQDYERSWRNVAGGDDALTRCVRPAFAEPCQPINLRQLKHREHLIVSNLGKRMH
jgi:hypothetical protein